MKARRRHRRHHIARHAAVVAASVAVARVLAPAAPAPAPEPTHSVEYVCEAGKPHLLVSLHGYPTDVVTTWRLQVATSYATGDVAFVGDFERDFEVKAATSHWVYVKAPGSASPGGFSWREVSPASCPVSNAKGALVGASSAPPAVRTR